MTNIINTLSPVFLIIALGVFLQKIRFFTPEFVLKLNKLTYWVGLPSLLFYKIANSSFGFHAAGKTFTVVLSGMVACLICGYIACFIMRNKKSEVGAFVQGAFRGNLVFIGLPIVFYSFAHTSGQQSKTAEEICILTISMIVPIYNILAVLVLLASKHQINMRTPIRIGKELLKNPFILSCAAGVAFSSFFDSLPIAIDRTFAAMGKMALPLALLGIGATLANMKDFSHLKISAISTSIKTIIAPLAGWPICILLGLNPMETRIALLMLACPTAISSFVLSQQLGGDETLSASIVAMTSLASIISFSAILAITA